MFLRVKPHKSSIKFGKAAKLARRFIGPFEILEKISHVAYRLALPPSLSCIHNVFHVSMLKKYVADPSHVIDWQALQVEDAGDIHLKPLTIIERHNLQLCNRTIQQVKVLWDQYGEQGATWEDENEMKLEYPYLFN